MMDTAVRKTLVQSGELVDPFLRLWQAAFFQQLDEVVLWAYV